MNRYQIENIVFTFGIITVMGLFCGKLWTISETKVREAVVVNEE